MVSCEYDILYRNADQLRNRTVKLSLFAVRHSTLYFEH